MEEIREFETFEIEFVNPENKEGQFIKELAKYFEISNMQRKGKIILYVENIPVIIEKADIESLKVSLPTFALKDEDPELLTELRKKVVEIKDEFHEKHFMEKFKVIGDMYRKS